MKRPKGYEAIVLRIGTDLFRKSSRSHRCTRMQTDLNQEDCFELMPKHLPSYPCESVLLTAEICDGCEVMPSLKSVR